jgi:Mg-chelatase subunit ChlD
MRYMNGVQFREGVEKAALKIASDLGTRVTIWWDDQVTTAGVNHAGDLHLSNVADDAKVSQALLEKYVGYVVHELLHCLYTDFSARSCDQYIDALHNGVEDAWIEGKGIALKLTGNIEPLLTNLCNGMAAEAMIKVQDWANPAQYPFVLAMYCRDHANNVPLADGLEPIFAEAKRRIPQCKSSNDTLKVAEWVAEQLQDLPKQPPKKGSQKPSKGSNQASKGQGEGEGAQSDSDGSSGSQGKDGQDGQDGTQQGTQQGGKQGTQQADQQVGHAKRPDGRKAMEVEPSLGDPKSTGGTGDSYSTCQVQVQPHVNSRSKPRDVSVNVPARLRFEVKKLFENSAREEFQTNRRAGSVNVKALHKVGLSDSLFKRRLETEGVDSAVVILLDVSGSMFYITRVPSDSAPDGYENVSLIDPSIKVCAALADSLKRAGAKVSILTFGDAVSVLKSFDDPSPKMLQRLALVRDGGSTNDYTAIRYSHQLLMNRPEERKVLFVLTDGVGDQQSARSQCLAGDNLGITTIGVGILENISDTYPQSIRINNVNELGTASFKQIKLAA